jgi:hypothetical protein
MAAIEDYHLLDSRNIGIINLGLNLWLFMVILSFIVEAVLILTRKNVDIKKIQ